MVTAHMSHDEAEVQAHRGFYIHLAIYLVINAGLITLNLVRNPEHLWFYWPLAGWGIGIALHAIAVFVTGKAADRIIEHDDMRQQRRDSRGI